MRDIIIDDKYKLKEISPCSLDLNLPITRDLKANTCNCCKIHADHNNRRQSSTSSSTTIVDTGGIKKCHVNKSKNKRRERDRLTKSCVAQ